MLFSLLLDEQVQFSRLFVVLLLADIQVEVKEVGQAGFHLVELGGRSALEIGQQTVDVKVDNHLVRLQTELGGQDKGANRNTISKKLTTVILIGANFHY